MNKRTIIFAIKSVLLATVLVLLVFWINNLYKSFLVTLPNFEKAIIDDVLPGISEDYMYVIYEGEVLNLESEPKIVDGEIYLPINFVIEKLNDHFYWDENEEILTYTTRDEVIRMRTDDLTYFVNNEPLTLNLPITTFDDGVAYLPVQLLLMFSDYQFTYNDTIDLLMIDDLTMNHTYILKNLWFHR